MSEALNINPFIGNVKIPDGELKPFKGWWPDLATLKAAVTAIAGDYAYVADASPATTISIYVYDATAPSDNYWADSGRDVDTSDVQTFETAEQINDVSIINDLTTGGEHDVLSAEQGKVLGQEISQLDQELVLGAVYDVSAKNPTAGPNNDGKWESLSALLSDANLNTLIPTSVRKGGMSIKFIQSSDNKYVQYRLMSATWSITVSDWQGVDKLPIYNSHNLAESGGIVNTICEETVIGKRKLSLTGFYKYTVFSNYRLTEDGTFASESSNHYRCNVTNNPVNKGAILHIVGTCISTTGVFNVGISSVPITDENIESIHVTMLMSKAFNQGNMSEKLIVPFDGYIVYYRYIDNWTDLYQYVYNSSAFQDNSILDVSELNNERYASLSDAIAAIPAYNKKGGMTIRFILQEGAEPAATDKYVQYRLVKSEWSGSVSDWQGVDDEPTAGSENLVKSGGVYYSLQRASLKYVVLRNYFPTFTTGVNLQERTFTIQAGTILIGSPIQISLTISSDIVFSHSEQISQISNDYLSVYLVLNISTLEKRYVPYKKDVALLLEENEVLICLLRWNSSVYEGNFVSYYHDGVLRSKWYDKGKVEEELDVLNNDVSKINYKLQGVTAEEIKAEINTSTDVHNGYLNYDGTIHSSNDSIQYVVINVEGYKRVRFLGISRVSGITCYAFYDSNDVLIGEHAYTMDTGQAQTTFKEYSVDVPLNAVYFKTIYKTSAISGLPEAFYCYMQTGYPAASTFKNGKFVGDYNVESELVPTDDIVSGNAVISGLAKKMFNPSVNLKTPNIKILDIGNSYTQDATQYLDEIIGELNLSDVDFSLYKYIRPSGSFKTAVDCYNGVDTEGYYIVKSVGSTISTVATQDVATNDQGVKFRKLLDDTKWDVIIIHQESSAAIDYSKWQGSTSAGYLNQFIQLLRRTQPQAALGSMIIHAYSHNLSNAGPTLSRWMKIATAMMQFSEQYGIDFIIPYGTAVECLRLSILNDGSDFSTDGTHLANGIGDYVANCVYYQSVFAPRLGIPILGNTWRKTDYDETTLGVKNINDNNALLAQKAAMWATYNWYEIVNADNL